MPAPVNIGQVLGNAAVFNFSRHRSNQSFASAADIPTEVEAFFNLLDERGVDYVLVGGLAMLAHLPGRNTEDLDLIVSLSDQDRLAPTELRVDFLETEHALFAQVAREFSEARLFDFFSAPRTIRCATPTGLLVLKLYALPSLYRQGQISRAKIYEGDIGRLVNAFPEIELEKIFTLLPGHGMLPSDVEELRRVVSEQKPRPDRFGSAS